MASYDACPTKACSINGSARGRALLDQADGELVTAVNLAASESDVDVLKWLKAQGADVKTRGSFDRTPMHLATSDNALAAME